MLVQQFIKSLGGFRKDAHLRWMGDKSFAHALITLPKVLSSKMILSLPLACSVAGRGPSFLNLSAKVTATGVLMAGEKYSGETFFLFFLVTLYLTFNVITIKENNQKNI